jgi:protoporphyrinogen oxidase
VAAYFLAADCDVTVFEDGRRSGGHCDSREIDYHGTSITVDLGAQFFHPDTHPIHTTLLEEFGLYDPERPEADSTIEAPGSVCVFTEGSKGLARGGSQDREHLAPELADKTTATPGERATASWHPNNTYRVGLVPDSGLVAAGR